jgi:hypothetical protein
LKPGEKKDVELALSDRAFQLVDDNGTRETAKGAWRVIAGGCAPVEGFGKHVETVVTI